MKLIISGKWLNGYISTFLLRERVNIKHQALKLWHDSEFVIIRRQTVGIPQLFIKYS